MLSDKLNELFSNFKSEGEDKIVVDRKEFQQAYGYSWLYVLGAYEALRTMDQEDGIFKEKLKKNIKSLKQDFANLRIPFAKQEYAKKHSKFIENEASVHNIEVGPEGGDLKFKIKGKIYSIRDFINRFNRLIGNIKPEDVLKDLRNASKK